MSDEKKITPQVPQRPVEITPPSPQPRPTPEVNEGFEKSINRGEGDLRMPVFEIPPPPPPKPTSKTE